MKYTKLAILFSLFSLFYSKTCSVTLPNGVNYNLSSLANLGEVNRQVSHFNYRASFCSALTNPCSKKVSSPASVFIKGHTNDICYIYFAEFWQPTASFLDPQNENAGIKLKLQLGDKCYPSGTNYSVEYHMHCDPTQELLFTNVLKISNCDYHYVFSTKYGCLSAADKGYLSIFTNTSGEVSSFRILLFLCLIFTCYVGIFIVINYRKNPKDGLVKGIPHRQFWIKFLNYAYFGANNTAKLIVRKAKQLSS